uniref:BTB domain-containing protein n=1 Tax=Panagrolaimus superbus TaxID=310955 RepID=A0A914Y589_9BILA
MKDILNPEKNFIENGKFKLQMKGIFFCDKSDEKQIFQTTLGQHLWERDDRDFVISVGKNGEDKTEIKIHKLILASRSPVFDAMLKAEMKEKVENRIEIVDFGVEIVEAAVDFFYDQESYVMLDLDNLIGLLQFADKYDVKDLKRKIENQLFDLLHPTNICQIVNASIISNSQMLKDICLSSMIVFHCQKVLIENLEILDKDFAFELVQKSFSSVI